MDPPNEQEGVGKKDVVQEDTPRGTPKDSQEDRQESAQQQMQDTHINSHNESQLVVKSPLSTQPSPPSPAIIDNSLQQAPHLLSDCTDTMVSVFGDVHAGSFSFQKNSVGCERSMKLTGIETKLVDAAASELTSSLVSGTEKEKETVNGPQIETKAAAITHNEVGVGRSAPLAANSVHTTIHDAVIDHPLSPFQSRTVPYTAVPQEPSHLEASPPQIHVIDCNADIAEQDESISDLRLKRNNTSNSTKSISSTNSVKSDRSSKLMSAHTHPPSSHTASDTDVPAVGSGVSTPHVLPGNRKVRNSRSFSHTHDSRCNRVMEDPPQTSTIMSDIENLHAIHGTASLGSVPIEQSYIYISKESHSLGPSLNETQRRRLSAGRDIIPVDQTKSRSTISSLRSLQPSPKSWFASNLTSDYSLSTETESATFLITPDSIPIDMASSKRNTDMHEIFPEMRNDEALIEDYSCAWQKEVMLQGRLYITTKGLAFNSRIIWSYSAFIPYADIISMEKKNFVGIIPSSIEISTKSTKYLFASFITRDATLDLCRRIWTGFPNNIIQLKSPKQPRSFSGSSSSENDRDYIPLEDHISHTDQSTSSSLGLTQHTECETGALPPDGTPSMNVSTTSLSTSFHSSVNWIAQASPTSDNRFISALTTELNSSSSTSQWHSQMRGVDRNASTGSLLLSKTIGLAELATFESSTGDHLSVQGPADPPPSESPLDSPTIPIPHRTHIVHQKHPVVLTKPDLPKARKPTSSYPTKSLLNSNNETDSAKRVYSQPTDALQALLKRRKHDVPNHPVECPCSSTHDRMKPLLDTNVPLPIEIVWMLLYGYGSVTKGFINGFWVNQCKHRDLKTFDWVAENQTLLDPEVIEIKPGEVMFHSLLVGHHRRVEYVVPLTNPLGPKETRCQIHDYVVNKSDDMICIKSANRTPDVPSGTAFEAITRICLTFVSPNITRMRASCDIEYSKSSWIKMAIDRAVPEGLKSYQTSLLTALRYHISETPDLVKQQYQHLASVENSSDSLVIEDETGLSSGLGVATMVHPGSSTLSADSLEKYNEAIRSAGNGHLPSVRQSKRSGEAPVKRASSVHLIILLVVTLCIAMANLTALWHLSSEVDSLRGEIFRMGEIVAGQHELIHLLKAQANHGISDAFIKESKGSGQSESSTQHFSLKTEGDASMASIHVAIFPSLPPQTTPLARNVDKPSSHQPQQKTSGEEEL
ncbi:hypothetical protein BSLG_000340 [Batrachochytrium salamandrivorans]|nr:hypothetical protein BSLG_000340 [Batrachochytrium salamandrivorans]